MAPQFLPFISVGARAKPAEWGVLRISSIPYDVSKNEIIAFLGRNARILAPQHGPAVHVIMERISGKTLDCFVEFETGQEALNTAARFSPQRESGRKLRLGDRSVTVEMSSQAELMKELFPKANHVQWSGQRPILQNQAGSAYSGFKTFITSEEMVATVKHVETPQRTLYQRNCLQRPYESFISTLAKVAFTSAELKPG
ncbi:MAG: hypothetical protein M1817_003751 [Caeruleum heppii]|nr:MAG: hypothetical protein M1817_003751 [Caeruleum heppii]